MINVTKANSYFVQAKKRVCTRYPEYYYDSLAEIFCLITLDAMFKARVPIEDIVSTETQKLINCLAKTRLSEVFENAPVQVIRQHWLPMMTKLHRQNEVMLRKQKQCVGLGKFYPVDATDYR
jgi:hypothetical protein